MPVRVKYVTSVLREHHERILEALVVLDKALSADRPDPNDVAALVEFLSKFVDRCHHSIEEYVLFSEANRRGFPFEGPIYVMVSEHGVARYLVRVMENLYMAWRRGDESAYKDLVDYARLYADHISQHIAKENDVLFPMLEGSVTEISPNRSVEEIEREAEHDKWMSILEELKKKYA